LSLTEEASLRAVSFSALGVSQDLVDQLERCGITVPSEIQLGAIPAGMAGRDVCGRAPTGSGKTLAYGLPLVERVGSSYPRKPRGLVLVPTRELAAQVAEAILPLARKRSLSVHSFYGGVGYEPQRKALRRGLDIAVACPGRLEDLIARGEAMLSDVEVVVVDEADQMADLGFLPAVRRILDQVPDSRQTFLFSATLDGAVDVLVRRYQREPQRCEVTPSTEEQGVVHHVFWQAEASERVQFTTALIAEHGTGIVFCRTRHGAERLSRQLAASGVRAAAIHGGKSQAQRDKALESFKNGRVVALVATDVAARGIHVDKVACVIHFDLPADHKDYVHRSGRTGRAGADGIVISLVGSAQRKAARELQSALGLAVNLQKPEGLKAMPVDSRPAEPEPREAVSAARGANGDRRAKWAGGAEGAGSAKPGRTRSARGPLRLRPGESTPRTGSARGPLRLRPGESTAQTGSARGPVGNRSAEGKATRGQKRSSQKER
jgi:superfamily II DNA/RNA helicase